MVRIHLNREVNRVRAVFIDFVASIFTSISSIKLFPVRFITVKLHWFQLIRILSFVTEAQKTCDHVTGEFKCRPGYIGSMCEHPCPLKTYGQDCKNQCVCQNAADCHHVTGMECFQSFDGSPARPC